MRTHFRHGVFAAALTAGTLLAVSGTQTAEAEVNSSRDHLVVYDNNIENMLPASCADGYLYDRFITYLKKQPVSPDIFTVQQISDIGQLNAFTRRLSDELPGTYAGKVAIAEPGSMGYTSTCGKMKNQQTNAVIYRSDRLVYEDATRWRSDAPSNPEKGTGECRNLTPTKTSQDRVHNIAVRLHDKLADKDVTIASIHWPTGTWHGPDCAGENISEANQAVDRLGGTLRIVAGDTNATTGRAGWWNKARGYGFRDPISEKCGGRVCTKADNTFGAHRIDFLLAKGGGGFTGVGTVTEAMTGGKYSQHRAVTARVKY
ncbi:hypothetical protein CFP71_15115 [Amycolatopsis thailandensis]|uniref:Endonuclease/exonuclease/phosphatase domain-containing protein n=1 Tax=Amycolatopsis thailandensis TaxID=589330 RepID=A0A229SB52_9PSEU|nr:hypothetical protein [Amycolatopsis thailandensis]OXM56146.1 hypothetical protein CFP71_15115 [Amycolatopsis thailandensis]